MTTVIIITITAYCTVLHALRRARQYVPPGKPRNALDVALRVMGGGGGPQEPY